MNRLIHGDCLEVLKNIEPESVDLIYLDPPFFSNRNYEIIWGDDQESRSFGDRFAGGIEHYIDWLKERVELMKGVLKKTGSIYLHCDYHANAYIKVKILDPIFGANNFRNEIIWQYFMGGKSKKFFARKHDNIYFYTKTNEYNFNHFQVKRYLDFVPSLKDTSKNGKVGKDNIGYYSMVSCPDVWQIKSVFNMSKERIGYPTQKPEALLERIIKASSNENDVVLDPFCGGGTTLAVANKLNRQWIGIDQSIVAIKVAEARLANNNQILKKTDAENEIKTHQAKANNENIDLFTNENNLVFSVELHKYDYDTLRNSDAFKFEDFIIRQFGGEPNQKQRSDKGIDGKAKDGTPIQVKRQDNIGRNVVDNFISAIKRKDKNLFEKKIKNKEICGTIIAFSFGKGIIGEVARLKNDENIIIELKKVEDIVSIAKRPKIKLQHSEAIKITRYSNKNSNENSNEKFAITFNVTIEEIQTQKVAVVLWDFNYDENNGFCADVNFSKDEHIQTTISKEFAKGTHKIAVKVADEDGLEAIDFITLHLP